MDRDILRRQTLLDDPLHLVLRDGRECGVVAVEKRQTNIFVTNEQRRPCVVRVAFAEAEQAFIGTLTRHDLLEHQPKIFGFVSVKFDLDRLAIRLFHLKGQFRFTRRLKSKIQIVTHTSAVDLDDPVIRF